MFEKEKITEWFHLYSNDVLNFLIYYTGRGDVEDLVQEVFIKAIRKIRTFNNQSSPKTWLFSIARNLAIDELRKQRRERDKQEKLVNSQVQKLTKSPEDIYGLTETNREIYRGILTLRQNYRDVLILRGIKELSVGETAEVLHWSENKVRVTYNRAIKALGNKLGGSLDE